VVGQVAVQPQAAEPAIGEVDMPSSHSRCFDRMPIQQLMVSIRIISSGSTEG
jgi:hypothetical protein